ASTTASTNSSNAPKINGATSLAPSVDARCTKNGQKNATTPNADATSSATVVRGPSRTTFMRLRPSADSSGGPSRLERARVHELFDGEPRTRREDLRDLGGERGRRDDHVGRRPVGDDLTFRHHDHPVGGGCDELDVVGRDRNRVTVVGQRAHARAQAELGAVVETARRLVEEH